MGDIHRHLGRIFNCLYFRTDWNLCILSKMMPYFLFGHRADILNILFCHARAKPLTCTVSANISVSERHPPAYLLCLEADMRHRQALSLETTLQGQGLGPPILYHTVLPSQTMAILTHRQGWGRMAEKCTVCEAAAGVVSLPPCVPPG